MLCGVAQPQTENMSLFNDQKNANSSIIYMEIQKLRLEY